MPYKDLERRRLYARDYNWRRSGRTDYSLGFKGEIIAQEFLKDSELIKGIHRYPGIHDLDWNKYKIDVKTSKPSKYLTPSRNKKNWYGITWKFFLKKQRGIVDFFFLICMNNNEKIIKMYLIPDKEIKTSYLSIGIYKSKYDKFLVRKDTYG